MPLTARQQTRVRQHIQALNHPDDAVSYRAGQCLIRYYGASALDELLAAWQHPNPVVRYRIAMVLGHTHDVRAIPALTALTNDADEAVRYDATVALGKLGIPEAIPILERLWQKNDDTLPAAQAMSEMGLMALSLVETALESEDANLRGSAIDIIGGWAYEYGDARCTDRLHQHCHDEDDGIREDAAFWLDELSKCAMKLHASQYT